MWYVAALLHSYSETLTQKNHIFNQYLCDFLVCDPVNCDLPEVPHCEDGQTAVLKNPGECQPVHECGMAFKMFSL